MARPRRLLTVGNIACLVVVVVAAVYHAIATPLGAMWSRQGIVQLSSGLAACVASMSGFVGALVQSTAVGTKSATASSATASSTSSSTSSSSSSSNNKALLAKASFARGNALFAKGDSDGALREWRQAVQHDETYGMALTNISNVFLQRKELAKALEYAELALKHRGDSSVAHYNRGVVLHQLGRLHLAIDSYQAALSLEPTHANARYNLGLAFQDDNQLSRAEEEYKRLLVQTPQHGEGHLNLCNVRLAQEAPFSEIEKCYLEIIEGSGATPMPRALVNLASLYHSRATVDMQTLADSAVHWYQQALTHDPKNTMALHGLYSIAAAAASDKSPVGEMSLDYVETLFNSYSAHFDSSLRSLDYKAHLLVAAAALREHPSATTVLDLGCGTGLTCEPLRQTRGSTLHITGVDISSKMLAKAAARECYNETVVSDIDGFLAESASTPQYDLALAADVFCYFGALEKVVDGTRKALIDKGVFAFTVEELESRGEDECGYALQFSGRFAHSECYIRKALEEQPCFELMALEHVVPRVDKGEEVKGLLVTLRKQC